MQISNALFEFTTEIVASASSGAALEDANIHADAYEDFKPGKTIRIDDLRQATPVLTPDGAGIRKDNAIVNLFFVAMPVNQTLENRLAARQMSEDMADEWLLKMFANEKLLNSAGLPRVCGIAVLGQFGEWFKPGTVKMPVCVLRLKVNPRN